MRAPGPCWIGAFATMVRAEELALEARASRLVCLPTVDFLLRWVCTANVPGYCRYRRGLCAIAVLATRRETKIGLLAQPVSQLQHAAVFWQRPKHLRAIEYNPWSITALRFRRLSGPDTAPPVTYPPATALGRCCPYYPA